MKSPNLREELSNPTLSKLLSLSENHQIVFRLHSPTSVSPLIWTGSLATSGFSSPDLHLSSLTSTSYFPFYSYPRPFPPSPFPSPYLGAASHEDGERKEDPPSHRHRNKSKSKVYTRDVKYEISPGPYLRHTVVDHIMNKSKQTCIMDLPTIEDVKSGVWNDDLTPWISSCENLFWAIWEVARRLSVDEFDIGWVSCVEMAIIRHPSSTDLRGSGAHGTGNTDQEEEEEERDNGEEGRTRSSNRKTQVSSNSGIPPREMWLRPTNVLNPPTYPGEMSVSLKEQYEASRKAASSSGEILFFGRVWAENVLCNLEWTREATPFELPSHLFQPSPTHQTKKSASPNLAPDESRTHCQERWIDRLIWDPKSDEYLTAHRKVMDKRFEESRKEYGDKMPEGPL